MEVQKFVINFTANSFFSRDRLKYRLIEISLGEKNIIRGRKNTLELQISVSVSRERYDSDHKMQKPPKGFSTPQRLCYRHLLKTFFHITPNDVESQVGRRFNYQSLLKSQ